MASSSSPGTITVINAGHGFSWVGCYVDGQNPRALAYPGISTTSSSMTVEYCASFCVGYNYMGVEYATNVRAPITLPLRHAPPRPANPHPHNPPGYCADTVSSNSFLATTETGYTCESNTYACAGNASEFCGGYGTLDLYAQPDQTTTAAYPDDTGGSYVYVTDSHIVHAQNSTNGNVYDYIGCWTDPGDAARALNGAVDDGPNDVGTCADFCQDYGIDLSQRCGGYYRLSLYELNGPSNFTDPHPDAVCTYNGPATAAATVISSSISKPVLTPSPTNIHPDLFPPQASTYTYYGPITTGSTETLVVTTDSTGATTSYTSTSYACVDDGNCATNPHTPGGPSSLAMNMPTATETTTVLSTSTTTLSLTTTVSGVLEGTETTTAWSTSTTTLSLPTTVSSAQASATASAMCPGVRNGSVSADAAGCVYSLYCGYELDAEATTIQGFASGDFTVCEALCDGVAGCVGFTWVAGASGGGGTCYLKPGGGELVATGEGYVGGVGVSGSCASGSGGGAVGSSTVDGSTSVTSSSGSSAVDSSTADGSTTVTSSVVATDSGFSSSSSSSTSSSSTATASTSCAAVNGTQLTTSDCKTYDLACGGSSIQGTLISSTDAAATNADCAGFCDDSDGCLAWTLDGEGVCRVYSSAAVSQSTTESGTTVSGVLNQTASAAEACVSSPTAAASPSATSSTTTTATTPSPTGCDAQNDTQLTSSACSTYTLYCHSTIPSPPIATTTAYSANACASTCDAASTCTTWSWDPSTTTCTLYDTTDAPLPDPSATNPLLIGTLDPAAQDPTCVSSSSSSPDTACDALNATQISTSSCRTYTLFCASTAQDASSSISVSTQSTNYACAAFCNGISGCASWTWDGETGTCAPTPRLS
ncbi:putative peroxidase family protein [Teratosphaeria destructans]|uniref:Peroxidase family protein n=1 Tax=Teratosphaeria destructans TaxID=418781 RepID=A0A9W7W7B7_9PEZI|nr:putative peroxidase family protein [Teratosphaeria destructans]